MSKKHLAYLFATTLLAAPAFAQTSTPGSSSPSAPSATEMQRGSGAASTMPRSPSASADINKALPTPGANQMMASDIRGTRVYGANNENVGDINDILLSRDGNIVALVVGVGGFLGIGQKDVAIPFQAFDFVTETPTASRTSTSTATGSAPSPAPGTLSSAPPAGSGISGTTGSMSADTPATTGSTPGATTTTTTTTTQQTAGVLKPERIVLRGMTKADLEAAPEFRKTAVNTDRGSTNR